MEHIDFLNSNEQKGHIDPTMPHFKFSAQEREMMKKRNLSDEEIDREEANITSKQVKAQLQKEIRDQAA